MHHVAILSKNLDFLPKIISGEKTIESRWYKAKYVPWDKIRTGDIIYFKNSGDLVTVRAQVTRTLQFQQLSQNKISRIAKRYYKEIGFSSAGALEQHAQGKEICILIFLEKPVHLAKPFAINKKGYGSASAWLCVQNIKSIAIHL